MNVQEEYCGVFDINVLFFHKIFCRAKIKIFAMPMPIALPVSMLMLRCQYRYVQMTLNYFVTLSVTYSFLIASKKYDILLLLIEIWNFRVTKPS